MLFNHISHPIQTKEAISEALDFFLTPQTLVLCDTRLLIKRDVLPYIPHVGYYDQRILPLLSDTNLIIADDMNRDILNYFQSFGLCSDVNIIHTPNNPDITLTQNILENPELIERLRNYGFTSLFSISVDSDVENLAYQIGAKCLISSEIMRRANDKLELKNFLVSAGLPTVEGISTKDPKVIEEYFFKKEHYFFKSPQGVSGYGFWSNKNNRLEEILDGYGGEEIIIEKVIEKVGSPSIQFCIWGEEEKKACIFGFTDQILEGGQYYLGNASPSAFLSSPPHLTENIFSQSEKIVQYIQSIGYIGFGGIDFMIGVDGEVYATEVNARFTGATYPAITSFLLSGDFDVPWQYKSEEGHADTIPVFIQKSIQEKNASGLFPLCIGPLELHGKIQVLYTGVMDD